MHQLKEKDVAQNFDEKTKGSRKIHKIRRQNTSKTAATIKTNRDVVKRRHVIGQTFSLLRSHWSVNNKRAASSVDR
jgi:hypothetical protein